MPVYLDNAATTKPKREVIAETVKYLEEKWHNPSSLYMDADAVKEDIENARNVVADSINAKGNEIFFTSGGSESNCWAIDGFVKNKLNNYQIPYVITSEIEHHSIIECVEDQKIAVTEFIGVNDKGVVSINDLDEVLKIIVEEGVDPENILVSIQFANNEIGTIQDIKAISELVHKYGAVFHTDAVQAFGHIPIDVDEMGIDMLSASGHKIGAQKGIGFLYIKNGIKISPIIYGTQMDGMRGGTENVPGIMGMAKAVELMDCTEEAIKKISNTRDYFISGLCAIGCKSNGSINRLPNNINVILPNNINAESFLYVMDLEGIMIGTGSACNSHSVEESHVLKAIGMGEESKSVIRLTFNSNMTKECVDEVINSFKTAIEIVSSENIDV